jgi:hypothetical protein
MTDEFANALAWFRSAPAGWMEEGNKNLLAAAEWIWEVLQGDFNDDPSTAQVVTGTVISMIPFVDQICDVRDVVANCKKIDEEPNVSWHWLSLALTLIGLFPSLGSLFKGCLKVVFAGIRKGGALSGVTPRLSLQLDEAIVQLNRFLARPEVVKALRVMNWDDPYKILAAEVRKVAARINTGALLGALNDVSRAAERMLNLVKKWGGSELARRAGGLVETIGRVRGTADKHLAEAVNPVQKYLKHLARRLEIESDMAHRAYLNSVNPHAFSKVSEAEEVAVFNKAKPGWVDNTGRISFPRLSQAPVARSGWTSTVPDAKRGRHPLDNAHETFNTIQPLTIPPGTKLYRVVDPTSADNSICWMSEAEFKKLKSKDDWRRRFAVWANWNFNGEFVVYTVPPGHGLSVWEGVTASQKLSGTKYVLEGGARQIVVDPAHLDKVHLSTRQKTGWGYDDLGKVNSLVGVPVQRNNVR